MDQTLVLSHIFELFCPVNGYAYTLNNTYSMTVVGFLLDLTTMLNPFCVSVTSSLTTRAFYSPGTLSFISLHVALLLTFSFSSLWSHSVDIFPLDSRSYSTYMKTLKISSTTFTTVLKKMENHFE